MPEEKPNLIRGLSANGGIIFCGLDSTAIARESERLHHTSASCSAALGRLLTAGSMMGMMLKNTQDTITLRMQGSGAAGTLIVVSDGLGIVRGCITNPQADLPPRADGHLDVGGVIGKEGVLTVIRDSPDMKEPYVGQIPLVSGEVAEDITNYYAVSEQIPTVCALGVLVDRDLSVHCAGGYLLQLLPGATEEEIDHLEQNISKMPAVTQLLEQGKTPEDWMHMVLEGFAPEILDEHTVRYRCNCSRERTEQMLLSLGRRELEKMAQEDPHCEVVCHFCNQKYQFDLPELLQKQHNLASASAKKES